MQHLNKACTWPYGSCIYRLFCKGSWVQSLATSIFFFPFFSFFSIPSQSASLYIIASFQVYLIDQTIIHMYWSFCFRNHILTPSIFDMPILYSISSPKSMTDMRGSINFRLSGEGGRTESDRKGFVNFLVLKLVSTITQPK